jgi:hypothetical protein
MKQYFPIAKSKSNFILTDATRANEEAIHALQVRFKGLSLQERMHISDYEGWRYEERIPEHSAEPRLAISALAALAKRTEAKDDGVDTLREELEKLVDKYGEDVIPIEAIHPTEYWHELAKLLFKSFQCEDPSQIKFKVVEQAREDFFG